MGKPQDERLTELDGLRGCAILMVLGWHYCFHYLSAPLPAYFPQGLRNVLLATWAGVDLFFVLSGFLIGGILLDNREEPCYFRAFYCRRVARIFPAYYLLFVSFLVAMSMSWSASPVYRWLFANPMPFASYATFTQNLFMGMRESFGCQWLAPTWSLAVEEQFYLVVPFLVRFLSRRVLAVVLVFAVLSAPILRSFFPHQSDIEIHAIVNTPFRSDQLMLGVLLALVVRSQGVLDALRARKRLVGGATVMLAGVLVAVIALWEVTGLGAWGGTALGVLFALVILLLVLDRQSLPARLLRLKVLVWFGTLSYGLYLYHQVVLGLVHGALGGRPPSIDGSPEVVRTLLALALTLLVATASYHLFEKQFIALGRRVRYSPMRMN